MELLPTVDEHSEAASHNSAIDIRQKRKASAIDLCNERESSSVCSLEASNDPNYGLRKLHEETDDSPYFSDNEEENQENMIKGKLSREGNRAKRSCRNAKVHNLSERKRRDKINEKIRILRELIPNCNKFPIPQLSNGGVTENNNNRVQMFGFSNQFPVAPHMSIPNAPFMPPIIGNSSITPSPTCYGDMQNQPGRSCG
ncbi:hypothetical protein TSUD_343550 [Trifolium subterraneum]|nr:hypothetical protein TSUD_343550 [Trifolium subterraneum]